jgi:DNA polymerase-4
VFVSDDGVPTILHADLDAFYASVEQRDDPALRGRPVIVGGGVVLAASYEARALGVRTAMGGARARALCPDAVVVRPRFDAYVAASAAVFAIFRDTAPVVEGLSIDEAFLDVSGLERISGTPVQIAIALRARIREEVGLAITVGVASTKFLAKVASGVAKPDGLVIVPAAADQGFLAPLPVTRLWGVGPATGARLRAGGLRTVGEVAAAPEAAVAHLLGPRLARHLRALAHNQDPRPVRPPGRRRSIGAQRALGRRRDGRPHPPAEVRAALAGLVDKVARRLRAAHRACRTVVLRLRFGDYTRATRSRTIAQATTRTASLVAVARGLLSAAAAEIAARGLTLVGVALTNLCDASAVQLALPLDRSIPLDDALDAVRERFGSGSVRRGSAVGREDEQRAPPQLD